MALLRALLRIFSYLFHAGLCFFFLGIAGIAYLSGTHNLRLEMLPWSGRELTRWLLICGLLGLISVILALARKLRPVFFVWSLAVLVMAVRGFFLSSYSFGGVISLRNAVYFTIAALIATAGAWVQMRTKPRDAKFGRTRL